MTYAGRALGVTVTLDNVANDGRGTEADNILSAENVTGSDGDDSLTGSDGANVLDGGPGNDTLIALGANDTLVAGHNGDDALDGGGGNDELSGGNGAGTDTLNGGGGDDLIKRLTDGVPSSVNVQGGSGTDTVDYSGFAGVFVSIDGTANDGVVGGTDNVQMDVENVIGSSGNDTIVGSSVANVLNGGNGNDELNGGRQVDTLTGGAGDDTLIVGSGADSVDGQDGSDRFRLLFNGLASTTVTLVDTGAAGTDVVAVETAGADDVLQVGASSVTQAVGVRASTTPGQSNASRYPPSAATTRSS